MAKAKKRRGPSLEDKYLGPEPNYHGHNFKNRDEMQSEYHRASNWYNYYNNAKSNAPIVLLYAEKVLGYTKKQIQALKKVENWKLNQGNGNNVRIYFSGFPMAEYSTNILDRINERIANLLKEGQAKLRAAKNAPTKVVITPAQRMRKKVAQTIMGDFDTMVVDEWMDGNFDKIKFPAYGLLTGHGIKGSGINMFRNHVEFELELVQDAYNKTCEQAVEAYSHISKGNKKKMITLLEKIIADIDRLKLNTKSARVPRAKKPKASDLQVKKLNYKEKDDDAKLVSINPVMIPGKERLFVYNTKTRKLAEYITTSTKGFEVRGTSIKNFDDKLSKTTKLRKPEEILPQILTLAPTKIKKVWETLTTKITAPNGRINKDCILLRVI